MNMAEKIRMYRKRANLTQEELADVIGVSLMTLKRWEWGERIPNAFFIPKLAEALKTTVGYLMGESPEPEASPESSGEKNKNLPINNSENENASGKFLDLGYWGNVADNAIRAAKTEDYRKPLIAALLRTAMNEFTGTENIKMPAQIIGVNDNHGNVKQNFNAEN